MRVEPFSIDSCVHALKRGARGLPITRDEKDKNRFLNLLFYMNDEFLDENWHSAPLHGAFFRPQSWPIRTPIVQIIAYTLMPNHIHLLLKEIREGGISLFMQKIGQSITNHFNEKYDQQGSLFQGPYKARTVDSDEYFRYVSVYIMVKNVFELYPKGGLGSAIKNFEDAWEWAINYPFSSLGEYIGTRPMSILGEEDGMREIFSTVQEFKDFSYDVMKGGAWTQAEFE